MGTSGGFFTSGRSQVTLTVEVVSVATRLQKIVIPDRRTIPVVVS